MNLRDRLREANRQDTSDRLYERFGILDNPFPASNQTNDNPHCTVAADKEAEDLIFAFVGNERSQVVVVEGTQGVGKTNFLNHCEAEIQGARQDLEGYYVVRYLADPEDSFEGTTRRLFEELGADHLTTLAAALRTDDSSIEEARSHDMRSALRGLTKAGRDDDDSVTLMMQWLLGHRLLKSHRLALGVNFRLETVESKTGALRDLVQVSGNAGVLKGIFLLLDEFEKQGGVLGPRAVVRYLSAVRAVVDALPRRLFLMIAVTPDALERYSYALPALRGRLENRVVLSPLTDVEEAIDLAQFYVDHSRKNARQTQSEDGGREPIVRRNEIETIYWELDQVSRRGDTGVRQRAFLHALQRRAERVIQTL